jgi:hypothetical protein
MRTRSLLASGRYLLVCLLEMPRLSVRSYSPRSGGVLTAIARLLARPQVLGAMSASSCERGLVQFGIPTAIASFGLCTLLGGGKCPGANSIDHFAAARAAEQSLHAACDEWLVTQTKGKDTAAIAEKIKRCYTQFYASARDLDFCRDAKQSLVYNALGIRPAGDIVSAGALRTSHGDSWSYVVWHDKGCLHMTLWKREEWRTTVLRVGVVSYLVDMGGVSAALIIQPDTLGSKMRVRKASWQDPSVQRVLRVPYELDGTPGVVEIRHTEEKWTIHPDRGVVADDGRWWPFEVKKP